MEPTEPKLIESVLGPLVPGLPLVVEGAHGSGRSVVVLETCAASLGRSEPVVLLTVEPPPLVLRQAESLGVDLDGPLRDGSLVLLELDEAAPRMIRTGGAAPFVEALAAAGPDDATWLVDPLTALTGELIDEAVLRAVVREIFGVRGRRLLATIEDESLAETPALRRVLLEVCDSYVRLEHDSGDARTLRIEKTRTGDHSGKPVGFTIGARGTSRCEVQAPAAPAAAAAPSEAPIAAPSATPREDERRCVLLVEHDPEVRAEQTQWLGQRFDVAAPDSADAVLPAFISKRPDIVVLDLEMPGLASYEILRAIAGATDWIPVLVTLENLRRPGDRIRPLVLGAADLIAKPADRFELLHKVDTLLQLAAPPPQSVEASTLEQLMVGKLGSRMLSRAEFQDRLSRAHDIGVRTGMVSSIVAVEVLDEEDMDAVFSVADHTLRVEDGLHAVSENAGLILLVASDAAGAQMALRRVDAAFRSSEFDPAGVTVRCAATDRALEPDLWSELFKDLAPWPELVAE